MGERFSSSSPLPPHAPQNAPGFGAFSESPSLGKIAWATAQTEVELIYDL